MSKKDNNDISYPDQTIIEVELEKEMKKSYIDYAMSVIARSRTTGRQGRT